MFPDEGHESQHYVYYELPNGQTFYTLSGVVKTTAHTDSDQYHLDELAFSVAIPGLPEHHGLHIDQWAPYLSLNSIANDGPDPNAAFAVDGFNLEFGTGDQRVTQVRVGANLAVRGTGAYLLRIGYLITLLGRVSELHG